MSIQTADNAPQGSQRSAADQTLREILRDVLGLEQDQVDGFDEDAGLFGHLPELDSMAVAGLLTEMEDRLDIIIDDDDIDGEMLETYGGLLAFAEEKTSAANETGSNDASDGANSDQQS
jgi:acyl carrier protein